jgi:hypothetical protein
VNVGGRAGRSHLGGRANCPESRGATAGAGGAVSGSRCSTSRGKGGGEARAGLVEPLHGSEDVPVSEGFESLEDRKVGCEEWDDCGDPDEEALGRAHCCVADGVLRGEDVD